MAVAKLGGSSREWPGWEWNEWMVGWQSCRRVSRRVSVALRVRLPDINAGRMGREKMDSFPCLPGRKYDEGPPLAFCIFATSVFACGSGEPRPSRLSKPDRCSKSKLTPNMEGANVRHGPCYRPRRRSEPAFACCCLHTGKGTVGLEWKHRRWFTRKIPFRSLSFFFVLSFHFAAESPVLLCRDPPTKLLDHVPFCWLPSRHSGTSLLRLHNDSIAPHLNPALFWRARNPPTLLCC